MTRSIAAAEGQSVHARICPLCEAHCGTLVTADVARGAILDVAGDPDDPFSRGYICTKARALAELHHDPDVIRTPLIKRNGQFQEATWEEALDYTAARLREVRERNGADSVGFYIGNPTAHHPGLLLYSPLLLEALGTRNVYCAGSVDHITKVLASALMYGDCSNMTVPDIDRTTFFVAHGANPVVSNGSLMTAPGTPKRLKAIRDRGGKVVVIDPRRTETANLADLHIPIKPGTDAFFLFAIIHQLFATDRVDLGEVAVYAKGLDQIRVLCEPFTPEAVEHLCGVPAEQIRSLATDFADAESAVWYGRTGTCTQTFGTLSCWLQELINILTGNFDRPGGMMFPVGIVPAVLYADRFVDGVPPFGRWKTRVDGLPELSGVLPTAAIADEILTPGEGQIRAFITMAGNPVLSHPNGSRLDEAFADLDFMLSMDIYLNETTRHADVILPSPSEFSHSNFHFFYIPYMVRKIAKWTPAVLPMADGQLADWDIFLGLAARLTDRSEDALEEQLVSGWLERFLREGQNPHCPEIDPVVARKAIGDQRGPDRLFDILVRTGLYGDAFGLDPGGLSVEFMAQHPEGIDLGPMESQLPGRLATPDGRLDLAPALIVADVERLRASMATRANDGSLLLVGRRHTRSNNSWMHNLDVLTKGKALCTLMIHPADAQRLGLATGDTAEVASDVAALTIAVEVTDTIMPGVVSIPHGWGHARPDTRMLVANGRAGANMNSLIDEKFFDIPSVNSVLNGIPVHVRIAGIPTQP